MSNNLDKYFMLAVENQKTKNTTAAIELYKKIISENSNYWRESLLEVIRQNIAG